MNVWMYIIQIYYIYAYIIIHVELNWVPEHTIRIHQLMYVSYIY